MTKNELRSEYFEWMRQLVCGRKYTGKLSRRKLLCRLHETPFTYTIEMDGNRAEDGIDLRYRFGYERRYERSLITDCVDDRVCSVLEMMVALAIRCEEHIMDNPDIGNRTGQWFHSMLTSLGLASVNDAAFDEQYVDEVIYRFLQRKYKPNGEGGLFTVTHCRHDLRTVEIWYQMCWYLDEIL